MRSESLRCNSNHKSEIMVHNEVHIPLLSVFGLVVRPPALEVEVCNPKKKRYFQTNICSGNETNRILKFSVH